MVKNSGEFAVKNIGARRHDIVDRNGMRWASGLTWAEARRLCDNLNMAYKRGLNEGRKVRECKPSSTN